MGERAGRPAGEPELELPSLSTLPTQALPQIDPDSPVVRAAKAAAARPRVPETRVLILIVLVVLALGFSIGLMVAGHPSLAANLVVVGLVVVLIWMVLPFLTPRRPYR